MCSCTAEHGGSGLAHIPDGVRCQQTEVSIALVATILFNTASSWRCTVFSLCCSSHRATEGISHPHGAWNKTRKWARCSNVNHTGLKKNSFDRPRQGNKRRKELGWRDGLEVQNADCSSRRPGFCPQHPHGISQLPVTPVPEQPTPSSGLQGN